MERNDWRGEVTPRKGIVPRYAPLTQRLAAALKSHRHLRSARIVCHNDAKAFAGASPPADLLAKVGRRANVRSNGPHNLAAHVLFTSRDERTRRRAPFRKSTAVATWRRLTATCT